MVSSVQDWKIFKFMELLGYVPPKDRLNAMKKAFEKLKPLLPKGNANHIAEKIKQAGKIPHTLVADSDNFSQLYNSVKLALLDYDPDAR